MSDHAFLPRDHSQSLFDGVTVWSVVHPWHFMSRVSSSGTGPRESPTIVAVENNVSSCTRAVTKANGTTSDARAKEPSVNSVS